MEQAFREIKSFSKRQKLFKILIYRYLYSACLCELNKKKKEYKK